MLEQDKDKTRGPTEDPSFSKSQISLTANAQLEAELEQRRDFLGHLSDACMKDSNGLLKGETTNDSIANAHTELYAPPIM